jgi:hypothetical protein
MIVGQRQPPWLLQPRQCCAEGDGLARQAPVVFAPAQMITLDETGMDGPARSRGRSQGLDRLHLTKDTFLRHLHDASSGTALDHVGLQAVRQRHPPGRWVAPPLPLACRLRPGALRREPCLGVSGQLLAGAEEKRRLRARHDAPEQPLGVVRRALADDTGDDQAPGWSKGPPHPRLAIPVAPQLRRQPRGLLGVANTPPFIPWACGPVARLPVGQHHQPTRPGGTIGWRQGFKSKTHACVVPECCRTL